MADPLILSTWRFGETANTAGWPTLADGGSSLDAVERACRAVEADGQINSVGYGGRPDRSGQVTLDASIMLVGHDMGLVAQFADTIGVMYAGKLVEVGPVEEVFSDPKHPYTKLLIQSLPSLQEKREFVGIPGLPPLLIHLPKGCAFEDRCPSRFGQCSGSVPQKLEIGGRRDVACFLYEGEGAS